MSRECGVKICGTTTVEDARLAADNGADYFGVVVEVDFSPRSLSVDQAVPLFKESYPSAIKSVALVFHMTPDRLDFLVETLRPHAVQFLNLEEVSVISQLKSQNPSLQIWQSVHLPEAGKDVDFIPFKQTVQDYVDAGVDLLIFDTVAVLRGVEKFGGTGLTSDWTVVRQLIDQVTTSVPIWLAGGIHPDNVARAIESVHPAGVDLCSGVEDVPGIKDPEKVRRLLENVRHC